MNSDVRHRNERTVVAQKFPANTRHIAVGGYSGWLYEFKCQLGKPYTMFAYWEDPLYMVKMVWPDPNVVSNPHTNHYFRDGRVCLTERIGYPKLEHAYAKSVLFGTAWSLYEEPGEFHF